MEAKATMESGRAQRWWNVAWAVCAVLVMAQTVQQHFGLGLTVKLTMETKKISKEADVYEWRLLHRYRNPMMTYRAVLLEDGWPLQRAERASEVLERKNGWFNIYRDLARFVPVDGSDPRTNGRKYEMQVPKQYEGREIWVPWLVLLVLSFKVKRPERMGAWQLKAPSTTMVFAVALGIALVRVWSAGLYSDGVFAVGGQPESDASGWYQHGQGLSEGWGITTGFSGQRPFYGVMLSPLFQLPGDPMTWIKLLHVLLWAAAAAGLYALGVALSGPAVGLASAFALMTGEIHLQHVLAVLTENPGLSLAILATLAMWLGFVQKKWSLIGVSGLLMGFGNLAAGATLFAIPMLAFLVLGFSWLRLGFRQAVVWSAVFTVGVSAVFLPWMIRQHFVMGTFTPSTNSATLLRGGADPVHKRMWPGMHEEAVEKGGVAPDDEAGGYRYHMAIYRQLVKEDPARYVKQVFDAWWNCFPYFKLIDPGFRLAGLLLLAVCGLGAVWRSGRVTGLVVAMLLGLGWLALDRWMTLGVLAVSLGIVSWHCRRDDRLWLVIMLVLNLAAGTILAGMAGNQTTGRMWQVLDWAVILLVFSALVVLWEGVTHLLGRLRGADCTPSVEAASTDPQWAVWPVWTMWAGLVCTVFAVTMTVVGPGRGSVMRLSPQEAEETLQKVRSQHPNESVHSRSDLAVDVIRLGHRRYLQPAGYDTAHWMSHYGRRPFDRWVMSPERADVHASPDKRTFGPTQGRGELGGIAADQTVIWVAAKARQVYGLNGSAYTSSDGVAAIPITDGRPDWSRVVWLEPCDAQ